MEKNKQYDEQEMERHLREIERKLELLKSCEDLARRVKGLKVNKE